MRQAEFLRQSRMNSPTTEPKNRSKRSHLVSAPKPALVIARRPVSEKYNEQEFEENSCVFCHRLSWIAGCRHDGDSQTEFAAAACSVGAVAPARAGSLQ